MKLNPVIEEDSDDNISEKDDKDVVDAVLGIIDQRFAKPGKRKYRTWTLFYEDLVKSTNICSVDKFLEIR